MPRRCYYDILGIEQCAHQDEIKTAYRKIALKLHPDKNIDDPDKATEAFQEVLQAYEVLSDIQERAWYDNHRDAILQFGSVDGNQDVVIDEIDLWPYFSSSCYKSITDDKHTGFYYVYKDLFERLQMEDSKYDGFSDEEYPSFGYAQSNPCVWQEFYAFFSVYVTPRSYSWLDKYDTRQAENGKIRKLMERENKKVTDKARKERNELVRNLVKFIQKRDKRVIEFNKLLEAKAAENLEKSRMRREKEMLNRREIVQNTLDQIQKTRTQFLNNNHSNMSQLERDLHQLDLQSQHQNNLSVCDGSASSDDEESLFCVACNKQCRSEKAYKSHVRSKQHLKQIENVKQLLMKHENDSDSNLDIDLSQLKEIVEKSENTTTVEDDVSMALDLSSKESDDSIEETMNVKKKKRGKKSKRFSKFDLGDDGLDDLTSTDVIVETDDTFCWNDSGKKGGKGSGRKDKKLLKSVEDVDESANDGVESMEGSVTKKDGKTGKKIGKRRAVKQRQKETGSNDFNSSNCDNTSSSILQCIKCKNQFNSKNKLFAHLKSSGHATVIS